MKIGKPVDANKVKSYRTKGRFSEVWQAVRSVNHGQWVPVACENEDELLHMQMSAAGQRGWKAQTRRDGLTLYIRQKPQG